MYLNTIKKKKMFYQYAVVQNYLVKINILPGSDDFFEASCNIKRKKKKKLKLCKDFLAFIAHATCFFSYISAH